MFVSHAYILVAVFELFGFNCVLDDLAVIGYGIALNCLELYSFVVCCSFFSAVMYYLLDYKYNRLDN